MSGCTTQMPTGYWRNPADSVLIECTFATWSILIRFYQLTSSHRIDDRRQRNALKRRHKWTSGGYSKFTGPNLTSYIE